MLADEFQIFIRQHGPRQQPRLHQHLEPVTYPEYQPPAVSEFNDLFHNRRLAGYDPAAQIIPVRKPTGQHNTVHPFQIGVFMPD